MNKSGFEKYKQYYKIMLQKKLLTIMKIVKKLVVYINLSREETDHLP